MDKDDIQKALEAIGKSGIAVAGDLVLEKHVEYEVNNVEHGGVGIQIINGKEKPKEQPSPSKETLEQAVLKVQQYFWAASSYAVIFCVCRDKYGYADNMSMFERELMNMESLNESKYPCKKETITSTMKNNTYMKKPIDNWEVNGAMERALILRDEFIKTMEQLNKE